MRDVADSMPGQEAVRATPGPMCHSPEDIELIMRAYLSSEPWQTDPAVLRLPWVNNVSLARACHKFCFAIAYGDEVVCDFSLTTSYD
jgi:amidase